jgi:Tfp pilus assembly protein FimT
MTRRRQDGFTVLEALLVVAILLIVGAMVTPQMFQIIDAQKLQSAAQSYAGLMQVARTRSIQDNQAYQVLSAVNNGASVAYVDFNGNSQWDPQGLNGSAPEPAVQMPTPIDITQTNAPQGVQGFDTVRPLNTIPVLNLATTPSMVNTAGLPSPGIAFNERGLPCQRIAVTAPCNNISTVTTGGTSVATPVAWVTYLRWTRRNGSGFDWAAVSVSPAGRIKTWRYQTDNGGSWQ